MCVGGVTQKLLGELILAAAAGYAANGDTEEAARQRKRARAVTRRDRIGKRSGRKKNQ